MIAGAAERSFVEPCVPLENLSPLTCRTAAGHARAGDLVRDGEGQRVEGPALDWETLPIRSETAPTCLDQAIEVAQQPGNLRVGWQFCCLQSLRTIALVVSHCAVLLFVFPRSFERPPHGQFRESAVKDRDLCDQAVPTGNPSGW